MPLLYRKATPADLDSLHRLGILSYSPFEAVLEAEGWQKLKTNLHAPATVANLFAQSVTFTCFDGERLVGMMYFVPSGTATDIYPAHWSQLRYLGVDPQGIARTLTQQCVAHARQTGETVVALHTSEFMHDARHIYESMGFVRIGEIPPRFGKKYWLYRLDL